MAAQLSLDGEVVSAVPAQFALYPYGGFTSLTAVSGHAVGWSLHEERLAAATTELWGHELDRERLRRTVRKHLHEQASEATSMRISVYPAAFSLAEPEAASGCHVLISSAPGEPFATARPSFSVRTVQHLRNLSHLKSTDLFAQIQLRREARLAGYQDALLMAGPDVLEGATWSIVVWRDGRIWSPTVDVLQSVTVVALIQVAKGLGYAPGGGAVSIEDLIDADLVLAVNVNNPARAISRLDEQDLDVDLNLLNNIAKGYDALDREQI